MIKYIPKIIIFVFIFIITSAFFLKCKKVISGSDAIAESIIEMRVNHFLNPSVSGEEAALSLLKKSETNKDPETWENFYYNISGFKYEWGYVYRLKVMERKITDDRPDYNYFFRYEYSLISQISKEKADESNADNEFNIILKASPYNWITKDENSNYFLMNAIKIDCETNNLCSVENGLEKIYSSKNEEDLTQGNLIAGRFKHSGDSITLLSIDFNYQE